MSDNWVADMSEANIAWHTISDEILSEIGGGVLFDIENENSNLSKILDVNTGIDALHILNGRIRGMAIRVQWGENYGTFTVRYKRTSGAKTEYEKRIDAIKNGWMYPFYTVQAYMDGKKCVNFAIVKTSDMYAFIRDCPEQVIEEQNRYDGNLFYHVSFKKIAAMKKYKIYISNPDLESTY